MTTTESSPSIAALEIADSGMAPSFVQGDIAIIRRFENGKIRPGEIVAARINNKIVLGKYSLRGNYVELISENRDYPIYRISESSEILGRVMGVCRNMIPQMSV